MKIEITQRCRVDGKDCQPGDIVETSKGVAQDRIGMHRAKKYTETPPESGAGDGSPAGASGDASEDTGKKKKGKKEAEG